MKSRSNWLKSEDTFSPLFDAFVVVSHNLRFIYFPPTPTPPPFLFIFILYSYYSTYFEIYFKSLVALLQMRSVNRLINKIIAPINTISIICILAIFKNKPFKNDLNVILFRSKWWKALHNIEFWKPQWILWFYIKFSFVYF